MQLLSVYGWILLTLVVSACKVQLEEEVDDTDK